MSHVTHYVRTCRWTPTNHSGRSDTPKITAEDETPEPVLPPSARRHDLHHVLAVIRHVDHLFRLGIPSKVVIRFAILRDRWSTICIFRSVSRSCTVIVLHLVFFGRIILRWRSFREIASDGKCVSHRERRSSLAGWRTFSVDWRSKWIPSFRHYKSSWNVNGASQFRGHHHLNKGELWARSLGLIKLKVIY